MEQYRPHPGAAFEGYYTRILLPSGSSIIFIICTIPAAPQKAHNITLTYVNPDGVIYQQESWPDEISFPDTPSATNKTDVETLDTPSNHFFSAVGLKDLEDEGFRMISQLEGSEIRLVVQPGRTLITHNTSSVNLTAQASRHTSWSIHATRFAWLRTPQSLLALVPFLPLHWHVYSLSSFCRVQLTLPAEAKMAPEDSDCTAVYSHQEKNWAAGFPCAHIWLQARDGRKGICLAGGQIWGTEAFLVGYRNEEAGLELNFRPPFALKAIGLSPFMSFKIDWENRTFEITVQDLWSRLVVTARGKKDNFYCLSAPYKDGFKDNWMAQTLTATVTAEVWQKSWVGGLMGPLLQWNLVRKDVFEKAGLEFGGEYYPNRGTDKKRN